MVAENSSDSELNLQKKFRLQLTQIYSHADICSSPHPTPEKPRLERSVFNADIAVVVYEYLS